MILLRRSWVWALLAIEILATPLLPARAGDPFPFTGPVDTVARRKFLAKPRGLYACTAIPDPIRTVDGVDFYTDDHQSQIDPEAQERHRVTVKPVADYVRGVQAIALAYLKLTPANPDIADCALDWLEAWAKEEGLTGNPSTLAGDRQQEYMVAGLAHATLLILSEKHLSPVKLHSVREWFQALGAGIVNRWQDPGTASLGEEARAWAFTAILLSAIVAKDRPLMDRGVGGLRQVLTTIDQEGFIPKLLPRAQRLRHAHMLTLSALVLAAEVLHANQVNFYAAEIGAIHRLADLVLRGYQDPAPFIQKAHGVAQSCPSNFHSHMAAWMEPYYTRFRDTRLIPFLMANRPISWTFMGGDVTALYGAPSLSLRMEQP